MTEDFRRLKRRKASAEIRVLDYMTQQIIGHVADLSESGMMITANVAIATDGLYQFELYFTKTAPVNKTILVGAHELWSEPNSQSGQMEVGFRFIDIAPLDRAWLRAWVSEPGSRYA
jgi:hypothetical protein